VTDTPKLPSEIRARIMATFRRRVENLSKAVQNDWPAPVVCLGVKLVLRSALVLYGEHGAGIVGEMLLESARDGAGLCVYCGVRPTVKDKGMCESCCESVEDEGLSGKCDGNHGGPRCADPECWNDAEGA